MYVCFEDLSWSKNWNISGLEISAMKANLLSIKNRLGLSKENTVNHCLNAVKWINCSVIFKNNPEEHAPRPIY